MHRFILLLVVVTLMTFSFCSNNNGAPPTVIVITPNLPKIDCERYLERVYVDFASRGLTNFGTMQQALEQAKMDCEAEIKGVVTKQTMHSKNP